MKIGIDIRALMEGKKTGVQVYITNLLEALFELDKQNEYVLFGNAFGRINRDFGISNEWSSKVKIFNYPNKLFVPAQKFFAQPKIDRLLGGIDLFFSPHWRAASLSEKVPLVVTFHDLSYEIVPEFFTLRQRVWHAFMDYQKAAKRASKIIAVSRSTKQDLIDLYNIPEKKVKIIYPGVKPQIESSPQMNADREEKGYFLYLGTFEPRKNIATVLKAYELYLEKSKVRRRLVLAGSSGWKSKIRLKNSLEGKVEIIKNASEEQKVGLFRGAFAFIFLSFYEGFGFPILEAASSGIPVISSFATSLQEIGQEFAVFVNPFRPIQSTLAMLELETDKIYAARLRAAGLEAVKRFPWEKTARETLEVFGEIK